MIRIVPCLLAIVCFAQVGCTTAARRPTPSRYYLVHLPGTSESTAFSAAEHVLGERFRIDQRRPDLGYIKTVPVSSIERTPSRPISDALGATHSIRRFLEVKVVAEGDAVVIGCKAVIEENQGGAHQTFERERSISDIPSDTPADREAGATKEQRAVWQVTGRDQTLESDVCRAIHRALNESTLASPASSEAG